MKGKQESISIKISIIMRKIFPPSSSRHEYNFNLDFFIDGFIGEWCVAAAWLEIFLNPPIKFKNFSLRGGGG